MNDRVSPETQRILREISSQNATIAGQAFDNLVQIRREVTASGVGQVAPALSNGVEFVLLMNHDVSWLLADLVTHTGTLRGNLYARHLALTIHESTLTLKSLLARPFREQLVAFVGQRHPDADQVLRDAHSAIGKLYDRSEAEFGGARDGILAHRDRDAEVRALLLRSVGDEDVTLVASELQRIVLSMLPLIASFTEIYRESFEPPVA